MKKSKHLISERSKQTQTQTRRK